MFEDMSSSLGEIDNETRAALIEIMARRIEYQEQLITLTKLRKLALEQPSELHDRAVISFDKDTLAPLRDAQLKTSMPLLVRAVDAEGLAALLPMVISGLMQSIDLPLLMNVLGLEPETIEKSVEGISKFIKSGFESA